jgi:hypothetical protein
LPPIRSLIAVLCKKIEGVGLLLAQKILKSILKIEKEPAICTVKDIKANVNAS